jgi:hypothetical protein
VRGFSENPGKIMQMNLVNHLQSIKLLHKHQYGFRQGKTTEHNLVNIFSHIAETLNNGEIPVEIFLDLSIFLASF